MMVYYYSFLILPSHFNIIKQKNKAYNKLNCYILYILSFISKHSLFFIINYYFACHINFYRYLNFMIFYSFNTIFAFSLKTNKIFKCDKLKYCIESFRYSYLSTTPRVLFLSWLQYYLNVVYRL